MLEGVVDYSRDSIGGGGGGAGMASTLNRFPHLASSEDIKGWGRWDSSCYTKYARLTLDKKRAIFKKITSALNTKP
jgi:hypothetical protein